MPVGHALPRTAEAVAVEIALEIPDHLRDVHLSGVLGVIPGNQAVEQHAVLHGRDRVNVFHVGVRGQQVVEGRLAHAREREVRWRVTQRCAAGAVVDQCCQFVAEAVSKLRDCGRVMQLAAVVDGEIKLPVEDTAVDVEQVRPLTLRALLVAATAVCSGEQCLFAKALVELPQVVEHHLRARQFGQGRCAEVVQYPVAEALIGNGAQLFLDPLDGGARVFIPVGAQADRDRWR